MGDIRFHIFIYPLSSVGKGAKAKSHIEPRPNSIDVIYSTDKYWTRLWAGFILCQYSLLKDFLRYWKWCHLHIVYLPVSTLFYWFHLVFLCLYAWSPSLPNDISHQWNVYKQIFKSTKCLLVYLSLIPRSDFLEFPCAVLLLSFDLQSGAISYGFDLWLCWASQCQVAFDGLRPLWPVISERELTRDTQ